jgi:hypothetical protein
MVARHWFRSSHASVAGAAIVLVAVIAAPASRADDAALAAWLTKVFDPIQQVHLAEDALTPILAPVYVDEQQEHEAPLEDVNVLKAPCDQLSAANVALQEMMSTPDPALSVEFHQAVDNVDTAAKNCAQVIAKKITDREDARDYVQSPLYDAESHLAGADAILAKLAKP